MNNKDIKVERITPKLAQQYLDSNKGNRALRSGVVERYARDMKTGRWTECLMPIAFYDNGDIANGQHRLWAIIESGTTQEFWVQRNVSRAAGLNIDTELTRTIVDNARISGEDAGLSNTLVAVAQFFDVGGKTGKARSNAERLSVVRAHRMPCEWAEKNGPVGKGLRNAPILAAVARAYASGADPERLRHFGAVLSKGMGNGTEDYAAIALRNYLIDRQLKAAQSEPRDLFLKAMNIIGYFLKRKAVQSVRRVESEEFPLKATRVMKGGVK